MVVYTSQMSHEVQTRCVYIFEFKHIFYTLKFLQVDETKFRVDQKANTVL